MSQFLKAHQQLNLSLNQNHPTNLHEFLRAALEVYRKEMEQSKILEACTLEKIAAIEAILNNPLYLKSHRILITQIKEHLYKNKDYSYLSDCLLAGIFVYESSQAKMVAPHTHIPKVAITAAYFALQSKGPTTKEDQAFYKAIQNSKQDAAIDLNSITEEFKTLILKAARTTIGDEFEARDIYTLGDYIGFALQEYIDTVHNPSNRRKIDIHELKKIIAANQHNDKALLADLHAYFNSADFKKTTWFHSQLKNKCYLAVDFFKTMQKDLPTKMEVIIKAGGHLEQDGKLSELKKQAKSGSLDILYTDLFRTKIFHTWPAAKPNPEKRKVVLALHGLNDSIETWNGLAPRLNAENFEVISYDQAGHGFDELRKAGHPLMLQQMHYDFYRELDKLQNDPTVSEIHLVGHSLGGAILSNSSNTINTKDKVKSVTCLTPAAMQNPAWDMITHIKTYLSPRTNGDMSESAQSSRSLWLTRRGGASLVGSLFSFIHFVADAFKNLKALGERKIDEVKPSWHVISGQLDRMVYVNNFQKLLGFFKKQPESPVKVDIIEHAEHHLHAEGSLTQDVIADKVLDNMLKGEKAEKSVLAL